MFNPLFLVLDVLCCHCETGKLQMRILNPYYNQAAKDKKESIVDKSTILAKEGPLPDISEIVKDIAENTIEPVHVTADIPVKKEVEKKMKHTAKQQKAFDHVHSQTLIDRARELKTRLHPISRDIPQQFVDLQKCLSEGHKCEKEISAILSQ